METNTLLLLLLAGVAVIAGLSLTLLLRKPDKRIETSLRDERDRLGVDLASERSARQQALVEIAALHARVSALEPLSEELTEMRGQLQDALLEKARVSAEQTAQAGALQEAELRARNAATEREEMRAQLERQRGHLADALAKLSHSERSHADMQVWLTDAQEKLSGAFAALAGKAFDERTRQAASQSKSDLEMLLKPFAEQLSGFRERVDNLHGEETRERATLVGKIDELKSLNQDMAQRAHELTTALQGKAKVRGDWGELMLESVLQGSGLIEGAHYHRQQSTLNDEGDRLQPDIVVELPDERRIVVDSKVNLVAWQEAMNAETPAQQEEALRRHAAGLRKHVQELGSKNYPKVIGERALEITVAFVPIEGALSAALGVDASLQTFAFEKKIVFASPNTLMALLRVIERLWTRDKIQREAQEIARSGGLVLDALTGFLSEFDGVGRRLDDAREAFHAARNRLSESNQALLPRARRLVELGAKGKKALPEELRVETDAPDALLQAQRDQG